MDKLNRQEAMRSGAAMYLGGRGCKNGHSGWRYTSSGSCVQCAKDAALLHNEKRKKRWVADPQWRERKRQDTNRRRCDKKISDPGYREHQQMVRREWVAKKRASNPEYRKAEAAARASERADPEKWPTVVLRNIRKRAKDAGIECTITAADIILPDRCPALGIPLILGSGRRGLSSPNSPSVDRIVNERGYIPGNVAVISTRANLLKKDATVEEVRGILAYMEGDR